MFTANFQQAFFDELEKLAFVDPATITAASTGTLAVLGLGSKSIKTGKSLYKKYKSWRKKEKKMKRGKLKEFSKAMLRAPVTVANEASEHFG
jgi:hypothetical protein